MSGEVILDVKKLNTVITTDKVPVRIVKDVSFQLKKGRVLALVGESGCGKSVTVHSVLRLAPVNAKVTAERILYRSFKGGKEREYRIDRLSNFGRDMRSLRGPEISMVFQDPMMSLNPVYKIGDQIIEGLRQHNPGIKKNDAYALALDMLKKLGIPAAEQRINEYPHQLSGGMKQRVVIAIAMICDPEIIIADEPTTALDVTIQSQIMELMKELQTKYGKSIILITHNMGLVAEMADDVAVMYMGRIVESGRAEDVFNRPLHPYTRGLLDSVPVLGMSKGKELVTIPGNTPNPADLKEGCEFADRCPVCREECRHGEIPVFAPAEGHTVRCLQFSGNPEVE